MVNTHTHNSASRKGPRTCFARWWYKKIFLSHTHCEKSIVHASLHECTHRPTHQVHQSFTSSRSANMHLNLHAPACAGQSITWCQLCRTRAAHPNPQSPPKQQQHPSSSSFYDYIQSASQFWERAKPLLSGSLHFLEWSKPERSGKITDIVHLCRSTDIWVGKKSLMKVEGLIQHLYSRKSENVFALKSN